MIKTWHIWPSCVSKRCLLLRAFAKWRKATITFVVSVRTKQLGSQWTVFHENLIFQYFLNPLRKLQFHQSLTRITGTLLEDRYTFLIISRSIICRMGMFETMFIEKLKTQLLFSMTFFPQNGAICEIMWRNIVQQGRTHITIEYGACAMRAMYLRLQIHTLRMCNTHCFCTTTVVARTLLNLLKPNDIYIYIYICRTAALTSRRYILNIYSTNIHTECFKHAA